MASTIPNSYKDPYWAKLALDVETKIGLPNGLLTSIITNGEKSNADQVSEAGARTPFQIIPQTRKASIDKFGIDPYLSPENAAEVAGLLLKDSLDRNKGDVALAVSEYHGGTNRANWGPRTRSYVARVVGNVRAQSPTQIEGDQPTSTFQRALANQEENRVPDNAIANIYQAYKSGQMEPEDKAQFEADVKSGLVMLPRGESLSGKTSRPSVDAVMLPQEVTNAYLSGKMTEQERNDLEADIKSGVVKLPPTMASQIPDNNPNWVAPTEQGIVDRPQDPTLGQQLVGSGEAGLTTLTGMTGGTVGMIGGVAKGITESILDGSFGTPQAVNAVAEKASKGASALTYAPRTETGREYAQNVGEVMAETIPVAPLTAELGLVAAGMKQANPAVSLAARTVTAPVIAGASRAVSATGRAGQAVINAPGKVAEMVGLKDPKIAGSVDNSVGSASVPADMVRAEKAKNLPVPVNLTLGAETRNAAQLAFEKEQMKGPFGGPLRSRAEENNLQALQNFETLIDSTDAQMPDLSSTGGAVTKALSDGYKAAKNKTRSAFKTAGDSPEADILVDVGPVIDHLNSIPTGLKTTSLPDHAKQYAVRLGIAELDENGKLVALAEKLNLSDKEMSSLVKDYISKTGSTPMSTSDLMTFAKSKGMSKESGATIKKMEALRKEISQATGFDPVEVRDSTILKKLIDTQTEPVAGPLYKEARALRTAQARKYENRAVVARLITNRKGMEDPKVAVDQVFSKSILNGSPEEITFLKRVLNTSGVDGRQAWKELQGALMKHIRDESSKGMGMDSADVPIVSPAKLHQTISSLDKNGRLDLVLGKKNAEIVRDLNDVVRYVNTTPPGTLVNNSGTSGTLLAAISEAGMTGAVFGLPLPTLTILRALKRQMTNTKIKAKIDRALNAKPTNNKF